MMLAKRCPCAARAASPSSVGAAYSVRPMSAAAPTACSRSFKVDVAACTARSRTIAVGLTDREGHEHRRDAVAELGAFAVVAHRHRAEDLDRQVGAELTARVEQPGERAADPGEHDVVDRAPELLAHLPHRFELDAHHLDAAAAPDRTVDRQRRRDGIGADQRADRPRQLRQRGRRPGGARPPRVARDRRARPVDGSGRRWRRSSTAPDRAPAPAASRVSPSPSARARSRTARWRCRCRRCRR